MSVISRDFSAAQGFEKYNGNKKEVIYLRQIMSYVLEPGAESKMSELKDFEDEDYVPEVSNRLQEDVKLHLLYKQSTI